MEIQFKGHSCFTIKNDNGIQIITDPYAKAKELRGEIITISHQSPNHNNLQAVGGNPKILDWPGEYEIEGIAITGITANDEKNLQENIIFKFNIDRIKICHLGDFNRKLTDELLDKIGNIDILIIPVGGGNSLNAEQAKEIIEEIDPRIIIPMHYLSEEQDTALGTLQDFLRKMGKNEVEAQNIFKITRTQLPEDTSEIVVLEKTL